MGGKMGKFRNFCRILGLGAVIGAIGGILFAPKAGKETRKELKEKAQEAIRKCPQIQKAAQKALPAAKRVAKIAKSEGKKVTQTAKSSAKRLISAAKSELAKSKKSLREK